LNEKARQQGFTLIEIMIVVAIMAGVIAMVAPRLASPNMKIQSTVRKMASLTHILQTQARLRNLTYRLVIQMSEKDGSQYWVENSPGEAAIMSEEQEKEFARQTSIDQEKLKKNRPTFAKDKEFTHLVGPLPSQIKILEVEFKGREHPSTEGTVYIYFFPQGLSQEAAIHIGDGKKLHWTLAIRPLTGQADIIQSNVRLKELSE
jgi:prepilin-type N-terminal cleavage/methylation domain-containing protein